MVVLELFWRAGGVPAQPQGSVERAQAGILDLHIRRAALLVGGLPGQLLFGADEVELVTVDQRIDHRAARFLTRTLHEPANFGLTRFVRLAQLEERRAIEEIIFAGLGGVDAAVLVERDRAATTRDEGEDRGNRGQFHADAVSSVAVVAWWRCRKQSTRQ